MRIIIAVVASTGLFSAHVHAEQDLSGYWDMVVHEDFTERFGVGPEIGNYTGLPINEAARLKTDSWDDSRLTMPEHQCQPHPSYYGFRGVGQLRILLDVDDATEEVVRIRTHIEWQEQARDIWMDGRPHPSRFAPHTWQGFSTGEWEGDTLKVTTTHLKAAWIRRNGLIISDEATMIDYFTLHEQGTLLTHITLLKDDNYLTEPLIRSQHFRRTLQNRIAPYPCDPVVEVIRPEGVVPHYLPGQNPYLREFADEFGIPFEAARGGAETLYPEYFLELKSMLEE